MHFGNGHVSSIQSNVVLFTLVRIERPQLNRNCSRIETALNFTAAKPKPLFATTTAFVVE